MTVLAFTLWIIGAPLLYVGTALLLLLVLATRPARRARDRSTMVVIALTVLLAAMTSIPLALLSWM